MRGIAVRQDLTGEWQNRGAQTSLEYAILTNEIMQGAFDLKVEDYKQVKGLERENLRDHMTDIRKKRDRFIYTASLPCKFVLHGIQLC